MVYIIKRFKLFQKKNNLPATLHPFPPPIPLTTSPFFSYCSEGERVLACMI